MVPLDGGPLRLARHADVPMNPASTMKLLTTYVALTTLALMVGLATFIILARGSPLGWKPGVGVRPAPIASPTCWYTVPAAFFAAA